MSARGVIVENHIGSTWTASCASRARVLRLKDADPAGACPATEDGGGGDRCEPVGYGSRS